MPNMAAMLSAWPRVNINSSMRRLMPALAFFTSSGARSAMPTTCSTLSGFMLPINNCARADMARLADKVQFEKPSYPVLAYCMESVWPTISIWFSICANTGPISRSNLRKRSVGSAAAHEHALLVRVVQHHAQAIRRDYRLQIAFQASFFAELVERARQGEQVFRRLVIHLVLRLCRTGLAILRLVAFRARVAHAFAWHRETFDQAAARAAFLFRHHALAFALAATCGGVHHDFLHRLLLARRHQPQHQE